MCIEESFDTIFNMGRGGGGRTAPPPPPMDYGSRKSVMDERVKVMLLFKFGGKNALHSDDRNK